MRYPMALNRHVLLCHRGGDGADDGNTGESSLFRCLLCDSGFNGQTDMHEHLRLAHGVEKSEATLHYRDGNVALEDIDPSTTRAPCWHCNHTFATEESLARHLRRTVRMPKRCPV